MKAAITPDLTARDKTMLQYIFRGVRQNEIARYLNLSEGTVTVCMRRLFKKMGVQTRAQLVKVALEKYPNEL